MGRIGVPRQTLHFDIPASAKPYTRVRLDPADRLGFFRLHGLQIRLPCGTVAWQWRADQDPLGELANAPQQNIVFSPPWEMSVGALLLLYSDDPWVELTLDVEVLREISRSGACLEVCAGWPMSADYLQASLAIGNLQATHQQMSALQL